MNINKIELQTYIKLPKFLKITIDSKMIYGLDILRATAILFVILEHGSYLLPPRIAAIHKYFIFDGVSIFLF